MGPELGVPTLGASQAETPVIAEGPARFDFAFRRDAAPLPVWTHRPASFHTDSPIVVVIHGATRDARGYRDAWIEPAETYGALVLAPEFSMSGFPTPREFEVGNLRDRDRRLLPVGEWSLTLVERLFDAAVEMTGSRRRTYRIYGHSAGAQFVHRLLTFLPGCRADAAVVANAGCYTLLDEAERYPYGLGGMPLPADRIASMLGRNMTVLLGEKDVRTDAPMLLKSPEAMQQGEHRFARGNTYYRHGKALARQRGVTFGWRLVTLPAVGHSYRGTTAAAADILLGGAAG